MMMSGKSEGKMSKEDIQAKLDVIQEMIQAMQESMGGAVKGGLDEMLSSMAPEGHDMAKVSVMADDPDSLEEGLEMAQEVVPKVVDKAEPSIESMSEVASKPKDEEDDSFFGKKKDKSKFY